MAQVDGYDAGLAAALEDLWRDTMLKGAKRGIEEAIAQQLEPIRGLIEAIKSTQASQFKALEARIRQLEGIDQRLSGLLGQLDSGTQQFTQASTQMLALPALVGQLESRTAKLGQLDAHLDVLERRANHPDTLAQIREIIEADYKSDEDRILKLRLLIGQLQGAPPVPPQAAAGSATPVDQNATTGGSGEAAWTRLTRWSKRNLIHWAVIVMGAVALALLALAAPQIKALFASQPTPAVADLTDPGANDERLIRFGWADLKAKAPEMAKQVEGDCGAESCDIVKLLADSLATGNNRQLAEAVFQLRKPIAGETPPECEYGSFNAMLDEARTLAARPHALRACVRNAQLVGGRAGEWTASNWNDRLRVYLIAIGSIRDLGEKIEPVSAAAALPSTSPAPAVPPSPTATSARTSSSPSVSSARSEAVPPSSAVSPSQPAAAPAT